MCYSCALLAADPRKIGEEDFQTASLPPHWEFFLLHLLKAYSQDMIIAQNLLDKIPDTPGPEEIASLAEIVFNHVLVPEVVEEWNKRQENPSDDMKQLLVTN